MTNFKKQCISIIATSALLLNAAAPVLAVDGSSLVTSGNGAGSENETKLSTTTTNTIKQNNNAMVTNTVVTNAITGENSANKNTGGDVSIDTGSADSRVNIDNMLNKNSATIACCAGADLSVLVAGNGADSENEAKAELTNTATVVQDNNAYVNNDVDANAKTGENKAGKNTGGDVSVSTGDADTRVGVSTTANANSASIGGNGGNAGGVSAIIADNGADSENEVKIETDLNNSVFQTNSAKVNNEVNADAKTGRNTANKNTNGDVSIDTGSALSVVGVDNTLNFNWAQVDCCLLSGDVFAKIQGNGADSDNEVKLELDRSATLVQDNNAGVHNAVYADAFTGKNKAKKNTGGDVSIDTGDAETLVGVDNLLNFNFADISCCLTGLEAKVLDNGADSENELKVERDDTQGTWQDNLAYLMNNLDGQAKTGKNKANDNTADEHGGDPSVTTGDSASSTSVSNSGNVNEQGGEFSLPEVELSFDMHGLWLSLWASFMSHH